MSISFKEYVEKHFENIREESLTKHTHAPPNTDVWVIPETGKQVFVPKYANIEYKREVLAQMRRSVDQLTQWYICYKENGEIRPLLIDRGDLPVSFCGLSRCDPIKFFLPLTKKEYTCEEMEQFIFEETWQTPSIKRYLAQSGGSE